MLALIAGSRAQALDLLARREFGEFRAPGETDQALQIRLMRKLAPVDGARRELSDQEKAAVALARQRHGAMREGGG